MFQGFNKDKLLVYCLIVSFKFLFFFLLQFSFLNQLVESLTYVFIIHVYKFLKLFCYMTGFRGPFRP